MKNEALFAILHNYKYLIQVLQESIDDTNTSEKLRIKMEGVLYNMNKFEFFFSTSIGYKLLVQSDNLAKSLQTKGLTACEGQHMAKNTITSLKSLKSDEEFDTFW